MLRITVDADRYWDERNEEFLYLNKSHVIPMEHSLEAVSKWESIWHKSFFDIQAKGMTRSEEASYFQCMMLDPDDGKYIRFFSNKHIQKIWAYINDTRTATTINTSGESSRKRNYISSELVYFWMVTYRIPFEADKWHLNRLMTLIHICSIENSPKSKKSVSDTAISYAELNAKRQAKISYPGKK